jgi:hypothetical protein
MGEMGPERRCIFCAGEKEIYRLGAYNLPF